MTNYNRLVRPVVNNNDTLTVYLGLHLSQLVDIDEKNQIMITSVWVKERWVDHKLAWNPEKFEGLKQIQMPIASIWKPDIVLYNTAEGDYDVQVLNFATIHYNGTVVWSPPAIFRSSCSIDIEFFPFDEQLCILKFGSWTYSGDVIDLEAISNRIEHREYRPNGEWDIVETKVVKNALKYPCCVEIYIDLTFKITLHRNPLFYIITLVLPCILISFMSILIFYLPSDAQEKITLCISVLLALIVFLLLIPDIIPPTSQTIPLIAKYMIFTMAMVSISIIATVVTINIHFRTITTHEMPIWIRVVFLEFLPRLLCMKRPDSIKRKHMKKKNFQQKRENIKKKQQRTYLLPSPDDMSFSRKSYNRYTIHHTTLTPPTEDEKETRQQDSNTHVFKDNWRPRSRKWKELLDAIDFIKENIKIADDVDQSEEDWRFVGLVIDRLLLWVFTIAVNIGTAIIILKPRVFWEDSDAHDTSVYEEPTILESKIFTKEDFQGV
ncbi:acetylcholine receptor subunit beta-like 2 isoform X2 [Anneissia japonica]|nr:acetylcholine receptor subunit beta-like 2 isoform X2 [Anneissia japonica]XP_033102297.1 acetylcholine receptor subunit beta-like 2 isoform X2 [Anneissia japonica]